MPPAALLAASLPAAVVETVIAHLAGLFLRGAGGDDAAAHHAAAHMLAAYHPETEAELTLAAQIVGCAFHALDSLGQAAAPDLPLTRVLRLRGGAVSLSREGHKAQRRLDQLQKARQNAEASLASHPAPDAANQQAAGHSAQARPDAKIEQPRDAAAMPPPAPAAPQANAQSQQDERIAASLKRAEARIAAQQPIAQAAAIPVHHGPTIAQPL